MQDAQVIESILGQYRSSLAMLRQAIDACPEDLWVAENFRNRTWHMAYHTLFYAELYAHASEAEFTPWTRHRAACRLLGASAEELRGVTPYTREELLGYHARCLAAVEELAPRVALDGPSGFDWLPFTKLETHIYNIGHIQHHTGQLAERLRVAKDVGVAWVRRG
ncbi:MAG TPA: DinB family protein [Terracidiphilus sp.]|nr:DinB family protein [Terracidiphilus sp.]